VGSEGEGDVETEGGDTVTADKIRDVTALYKTILRRRGYAALRASDVATVPTGGLLNGATVELQHVLWMCDEIDRLLESQLDRANRWLGFVQGVLWMAGVFTIRELADHNHGESSQGSVRA
jgi:hypothetical protein